MAEFATVKRFCAIEGRECEKTIPYQGSWTYFFAYPSSEHWRDFSFQLSKELAPRGIIGERWEDVVKNDLLFSKVCEGIHGHDFLLAEITEPNPNVLLEIGYGLAVGRQPILLRDKNRKPWARQFLTALESCFYETRDDILFFISNLQHQLRVIPYEPDRRLPFLENMGIFDFNENPGTIYHLKPKMSADWIRRVDRTLKNSYFKLGAMDPSDAVYDEFYPQARQIQSASLIVASLVSSEFVNWEEQNANVALLVGFAIGLGKQVLVLQQNPAVPILDLGSVTRIVDSESQAEQIIKSWLANETQLLVSQRAENRRQHIKSQQVERIRGMYLGHPDALQDNRLLDYFVPTKEFEDAIEARRTIFIGRRGTGKSANFKAVKEGLRERPKIVVSAIAPDDFQFERISGFLEDEFAKANSKMVFQNTWNYVLVSEILRSLAEETERLYVSPNDLIRTNLYRFYEDNRQRISLEFGSRLIAELQYISSIPAELSSQEKREKMEASIHSLRDYNISRQLKDFANQEDITYFVVADDLDKHWRPDSMQSIELLLGLIAETDRLQRFFEGRLKVVLFLREDIYDVLARHDEDLPKRNFLRMEWTPENLKHLVAERIAEAAGESNDDDDTTWSVIFPETVKGASAQNYIISRSLPRPRDVLDFCQKAIDQAQRNGHEAVTEKDVLDGEESFSDALFWSVAMEFKGLYPNLEDVLFEFAGAHEDMPWDKFEEIARIAIDKNKSIIGDWFDGSAADPQYLASILFKTGIVGLSKEYAGTSYYSNGRSFAETWSLVSPTPRVHIHPAFSRALDVSADGLRISRTEPTRRRVDPRQTSLDIPDC